MSVGEETAAGARHLGGVGSGGDDARLFDDHRRQVVLVVHPHVEGDAEGQGVGADHVFHELVGCLGVQASVLQGFGHLARGDASRVADELAPGLESQFVKTAEP
jgi:hypothetical protein